MHPIARTEGIQLESHDTGTVLVDTRTGVRQAVTPHALAVWQAADGQRTVAELALVTGLTAADVSLELDRLADGGLLVQRVAPPVDAPVARRSLLRTLAGASLGGAVLLSTKPAQAEASLADEKRKKMMHKRDRYSITTGKATFEGTFDPDRLYTDATAEGEFLFLAGTYETFGQKVAGNGVKELADILENQSKLGQPLSVTLGVRGEAGATYKGTIAEQHVGFSLFLKDGSPVRAEFLLTLKIA